MKRRKKKGKASPLYKKLKSWHKWVSIVLTFFLLMFATSGIILNHRTTFSSFDVNRNILPPAYHYKNWNLASVRGSTTINENDILIYGNIGIWKTNSNFSSFEDFNKGFPKGIDNRKISKVIQSNNGDLIAGTFFGLYTFSTQSERWEKVLLPISEERIVDVIEQHKKVYILTRSFMLVSTTGNLADTMKIITLPPPIDYDNKIGLFKTFWVIHSGEIFGVVGTFIVDFMAVIIIFITLTGLILWLFPGLIKKRKKKSSKATSFIQTLKFSLKWHNRMGYYLAIFITITATTGMFLRPPLLIPIANSKVKKIPYSLLDQPNPWFDKLRAIIFDYENDRFVISTSDGFYYSDDNFSSPLKRFTTEPAMSVMGINIFENLGHGGYLIGSFSGLFSWSPDQNYVENLLPVLNQNQSKKHGGVFTENSIAGLVTDGNGNKYIFNYDKGVKPFLHNNAFPPMPDNLVQSSPISLWNLALEIHTGRIYGTIIGDFYIFIVPLVGLSLLIVVISGFWMYWMGFRKKYITKKLTTPPEKV